MLTDKPDVVTTPSDPPTTTPDPTPLLRQIHCRYLKGVEPALVFKEPGVTLCTRRLGDTRGEGQVRKCHSGTEAAQQNGRWEKQPRARHV